jgi:hypothetical protein
VDEYVEAFKIIATDVSVLLVFTFSCHNFLEGIGYTRDDVAPHPGIVVSGAEVVIFIYSRLEFIDRGHILLDIDILRVSI